MEVRFLEFGPGDEVVGPERGVIGRGVDGNVGIEGDGSGSEA